MEWLEGVTVRELLEQGPIPPARVLDFARQIAEAHRGTLTVRNRKGARGAEAVITLPARAAADRLASGS